MRTNTLPSKEVYRDSVMQLPQVLHGAVSEMQAELWLDRVCKIYPANRLSGFISQQAGIGADDMRALIAHNRNEYFPTLSPNEVLKRKWLDTDSLKYAAPNETKLLFLGMAREVIAERYGMNRDKNLESALAAPMAGSWLIGRPALALRGQTDLLIDIQFEESQSAAKLASRADAIRLHHYDLAASQRGVSDTELLLVKVAIDPAFMDAVSALASASPNIKNALARNASSFRKLDPGLFNINVHRIEKDKHLYPEILEAGSQAWGNLMDGRPFVMRQDKPLELSKDQASAYQTAAKDFCAAETLARAATEFSNETKDRLIQTARAIGIDSNHKPEFTGAEVRSYDRFDKIGAATLLQERYGITRSQLCDNSYDTESMAATLKAMGVDPSRFQVHGEFNKDKILDVAEQLHLDLSEYKGREFRAQFSRKTRGPIFEALDEAKRAAVEPVKALQRELIAVIDSTPAPIVPPTHKQTKGMSPK